MTQRIAVLLRRQEKVSFCELGLVLSQKAGSHFQDFLQQSRADRYETALDRLEEVDKAVNELEQGLATLKPQLAVAEQEVQQRMDLITDAKEKYVEETKVYAWLYSPAKLCKRKLWSIGFCGIVTGFQNPTLLTHANVTLSLTPNQQYIYNKE